MTTLSLKTNGLFAKTTGLFRKTAGKTVLAAALAATALGSATPAMADPYRGNRGSDATGTAIAAGIFGLAIGAIIASSSNSNRDRYDERAYNRYNRGYDNGYNGGGYNGGGYNGGGYNNGYAYRNGYYYDRQGNRYDRDGRAYGYNRNRGEYRGW